MRWFKRQLARGLMAAVASVLGAVALVPMVTGSPVAHAATLEGQTFDPTVQLAERALRLNGLGLRGVAWVKAFVAGLYLPATTRDASVALSMPGPKRLQLKIMLEAPAAELSKSLNRRVRRHEAPEVQQKLATRLTALTADINAMGTLKPGDVIDVDLIPDRGVQLRKNGQPVGKVQPGDDLYRAVLKVFIGEHAIDARMKEGLMRGGVRA
jgi:hypothetical protein